MSDMDTPKEAVIAIDDQRTAPLVSAREAALAALYPDEPNGIHTVINISLDPEMIYAEKRLAREQRRVALAEEGDSIRREYAKRDALSIERLAAARAKRERRQARNLRTR